MKKLIWIQNAIKNDIEAEPQMEIGNTEEKKEETNETVSKFDELKTKTFFSNQDLHTLMDLYLHRFDDEIEQISTKNAIGKRSIGQHFSREKAIQMTLDTDKNEYETGGIGKRIIYL